MKKRRVAGGSRAGAGRGNMVKIAAVIGVVLLAVAAVAFYTVQQEDAMPERMHGTISTAVGSSILGDPDAPITVVEFGDYQCHQCYNWFHQTKPDLFREYIDTGVANFVFVDMAFLGRDSNTAAQASYCAEDQGMYWEYHEILYQNQKPRIDGGWADRYNLEAFAVNLKLDTKEFNECLDSSKYASRVKHNIDEAHSFGVSGTPTFAIVSVDGGEQKIVGAQPYQVFKRVIDSMIPS